MEYLVKNGESTRTFNSLREVAELFNIKVSQVASYINTGRSIDGYTIKKGIDTYKKKKDGNYLYESFGEKILGITYTDRTENIFDSHEVIKMLKSELRELKCNSSNIYNYMVNIELPEKIVGNYKYRISVMVKTIDIPRKQLFDYGRDKIVPLMDKIIFFIKTCENDA